MRGLSAATAWVVATLTLAASSEAQTGRARPPEGSIALDQLQPSPPGDPFVGVPSPFIGGHLVFRGQLFLNQAEQPLTVTMGSTRSAVVGRQRFMGLGASIALEDRLQVSVLLPIALSQHGDCPVLPSSGGSAPDAGAGCGSDPPAGSVKLESPAGPSVGDLRLGARLRLSGAELDPGQFALGFYLHLPTGPDRSYVSDHSMRFQPHLLFGGRKGPFSWSFTLGGDIRTNRNPSALTAGFGLGAAILRDFLQIQAEVFSSTLIQEGAFQVTEHRYIPRNLLATNAESLFGAQVRVLDDLVLRVAGGPGWTDAPGTPVFRMTAGLAWSPRGSADAIPEKRRGADPDVDGIRGEMDDCPFIFGVVSAHPGRNGCPFLDRDTDKIHDEDDACPDRAGIATADPKNNGCPADKDEDGIEDDLDLCKEEPGTRWKGGCPEGAPRKEHD